MPEIQDIVETTQQAELLLWWQWVLLGLVVSALLALLVFLFNRKRTASRALAQSPLQTALQQLSMLKVQQTTSNQLATQLSLIVREFLQRRFDDHALFQTEEEFHSRSADLEKLPAATSTQLKVYLRTIAEHKYAPNPNHPAALESLIEKASSLIKKLDSTSATSSAQ